MEEELKCPQCKNTYVSPVLLPCYHAICLNCAINLQVNSNLRTNSTSAISTSIQSSSVSSSSSASSTASSTVSSVLERAESVTSATSTNSNSTTTSSSSSDHTDFLDIDKLSIVSETDSGVICLSSSSRPNSFISPLALHAHNNATTITPPPFSVSLICPVCQKRIFFDENGVHNLPKYKLMQNVIEKYQKSKQLSFKCQMCVQEPAKEAIIKCDQCQVLYCEKCRESCHPSRGPLAKHIMHDPRKLHVSSISDREKCYEHPDEPLANFCSNCKLAICNLCLAGDNGGHHRNHEIQSLAVICKSQKTELSQNLQRLSEKARSTTEFIQRLKGMSDKICVNCTEFESIVSAQCDTLIEALRKRRDQLLDCIRQDKELRICTLRDQVISCTNHLQSTTGLLQFCIEALKETDHSAFLQVGLMLVAKVNANDLSWNQNLQAISPRVFPNFDLTLDDKSLMKAIDQLNFIQMKPFKNGEDWIPAAPGAPIIVPEECNADNNSVTISWRVPKHSHVESFVLELDDGNGGEFREVYCGMETICTVDGLHFNSLYNARVKALNSTGEGEYSDLIGLQTAEYAWFTFDPVLSATGMQFSPDNLIVTNNGWEHCVALGTVGFSRGVHYWEYILDNFDIDTDPAFGIARIDVNRTKMLGKDEKGWAMYIDRSRSWFQHYGIHERRLEGGVFEGGTVGVLLDLNHHTLSFYVNDEPQGGIAFRDLYGVFYPAVSLNRGVRLTLHTSLEIPTDVDVL